MPPDRAIPEAYLITFRCYGTFLHGDERGSVDRRHNQPGSPLIPFYPERVERESALMDEPPYEMDDRRRDCVLSAILEVCAVREWRLWAAHVRENHVHVVATGQESPERMMNDFKSYATRTLRSRGLDQAGQKHWARHGSTRYLWDKKALEYAVHYVVEEQGEPMAVYDHRRQGGA